MTTQEVRTWVHLRDLRPQGLHFRRQVPIAGCVVDFACLRSRLVVEIDGGQHGRPPQQRQDDARDRRLEECGFKVLRFWNIDVDRSMVAVIDTIVHFAVARIGMR